MHNTGDEHIPGQICFCTSLMLDKLHYSSTCCSCRHRSPTAPASEPAAPTTATPAAEAAAARGRGSEGSWLCARSPRATPHHSVLGTSMSPFKPCCRGHKLQGPGRLRRQLRHSCPPCHGKQP